MKEFMQLFDSAHVTELIVTFFEAVIAVAAAHCTGKSRDAARTVMFVCLVLIGGVVILAASRDLRTHGAETLSPREEPALSGDDSPLVSTEVLPTARSAARSAQVPPVTPESLAEPDLSDEIGDEDETPDDVSPAGPCPSPVPTPGTELAPPTPRPT